MTSYRILYLPRGEYLYFLNLHPCSALYSYDEIAENTDNYIYSSSVKQALIDIISYNINVCNLLYFIDCTTAIRLVGQHLEIVEVEDV